VTDNIEQMARERPRDLSQRPSRRDVPRELPRKAAEAIQRNRPIRNVSRCAEGESMTANTEYVLVPKRPTKRFATHCVSAAVGIALATSCAMSAGLRP
jgi:hypothetical protein